MKGRNTMTEGMLETMDKLVSGKRKEVQSILEDKREDIVNFLQLIKENPDIYDDAYTNKVLMKLQILEGGGIYIPGVHKVKVTEMLDEAEMLRVMNREDFIDYSILFFGANYKSNLESNQIFNIKKEILKEISLYGL